MNPNENPIRKPSGRRHLGFAATSLSALMLANGSMAVSATDGNANRFPSTGPSIPPTIEPGVSPWRSVNPSLEATTTPIESPNSSPSASPSEQPSLPPEIPVYLTPEMQLRATGELGRSYEIFKSDLLLKAGNGAMRVQFDQDRKSQRAALEYQGLVEMIALYMGDVETADKLFKFDDRYKQRDGLTPWLVKNNPRNEILDETVVSGVMMVMATARLLHPDPVRQDEGRQITDSLIDEGVVESGPNRERRYNVPQAFHWSGSDHLTNPAYWSPFYIELFSRIDPYWEEVAQDTRALFGKLDERIMNGEIVYFPNWVTIEGELSKNGNDKADFTYDAAYIPFQQAMGALYCEDPVARNDARKQLASANEFFYDKIAVKDADGNVTDYKSDNLVDDYDLKTGKPTGRWSDTALTSAAALSSIMSGDEAYRNYMFEVLVELSESPEPFNEMMRLASLLVLSGRMETADNSGNNQPQSTPEAVITPSPEITPEPVITAEPTTEAPVANTGEIILRPGEVIMNGDPNIPELYLTVDDGWDDTQIERILDIAKAHDVRLTFFPVGDVVRANPELYKRAYLEGHSIQNHSMTHTDRFDDPETFREMTEDEIRDEILDQLHAVRDAIGDQEYIQHSFRPPYGVGAPPWYELDPRFEKVARELGYAITTWTEFSEGWRGISEEEVIDQLDNHIANGSILGLHAIQADVDALDNFIIMAKEKGLEVGSLDSLFEQPSGENQNTEPKVTDNAHPTTGPEAHVFEGIVGPGEEVHEGSGTKPEIFFTIDDGWDANEIEQILDIAKKHGAKLTFFPVGQQIVANPELYRRAYREGHSIQNHTWSHTGDFQNLSNMTDGEIEEEIKKQRKTVRQVLGVEQQYFVRIPHGSGMGVFGQQLSERISRIARKMGLAIAAWSAISDGWMNGRQNTIRQLRGEIRKGAIITLHDEPEDIEALEAFIKQALAKDIKPVTMDRLFEK